MTSAIITLDVANDCRTSDYLISRALQSPTAPPFLGLITIEEEAAEQALARAKALLMGRANRLEVLFARFPFLAAWSIAQTLAKGYGEDDRAIYRLIEVALGIQLPASGHVRRSLFDLFCAFCERRGMPTRGFDRMVDVYLVQAGVPMPLLPWVIDAFLRQERAFGPPPTETTALLNRWEDDALVFLPPAVVTPRRAILADETAFHAAVYARLRSAAPVPEQASAFERLFFDILHNKLNAGVLTGISTMAPPRPNLIWRRGGIELAFPKAEGRFQLRTDDDGRLLRVRGGESWPLPQPWPRRMHWQVGPHADTVEFLAHSHSIAVFDLASGRLVREVRVEGGDYALDARDVLILSRLPFTLDGEPATTSIEGGHHAFAKLGAVALTLVLDGHRIGLSVRPRRRIGLRNGIVAQGPRGALHGPDAQVVVETGLGHPERRWLRLTLSGSTQRDYLCTIGGEGTAEVPLATVLRLFAPAAQDPARLRIELMAPSEAEAPATQSSGIVTAAWVWPGFVQTNGFVYESAQPPRNLISEQSLHVGRDDRGRPYVDPAGGYGSARAVFAIDDEFVPFNFPWPDVSVTRQDMDGNSGFLPLGTRLLLGSEDRFDSIVIRSPDPRASLSVCGRIEPAPFRDGLARTIPLRDLLAPTKDHKVVLFRADGNEVVLLEVMTALEPLSFEARRDRGTLRLRLRMPRPVDAVQLELEDETGKRSSAAADLGYRPVGARRPDWLEAEINPEDADEIKLTVSLASFTDGVTLARLLVRPTGEDDWQPLRARRGDTYALALAAPARDQVAALDSPRQRFETLSRWMADCYAPACWPTLDNELTQRWTGLGRELLAMPMGRGAVMLAAAAPPPDDAAPSWVPIAHPLQFAPDLYAAPPADFAVLSSFEDPSVAGLAALFPVSTGRLRDIRQLHSAVFLAFRNAAVAEATGAPLEGFQPERYQQMLSHPHVDGDPTAGWYWRGCPLLGPDHWRAAHLRFAERLEAAGLFTDEAVNDGPNSMRQEALQRLIIAAWQGAYLRPPAPRRNQLDAEPYPVDLWTASLLCDFARACRFGEVTAFVDALAHRVGTAPKAVLTTIALVVRLAPELFGFYMLLWQIAKDRP